MNDRQNTETPKGHDNGGSTFLLAMILAGLLLSVAIFTTVSAEPPTTTSEERVAPKPPSSQPADTRPLLPPPRLGGEGPGPRRPLERLREMRQDGFAGGGLGGEGGGGGLPMGLLPAGRPNLNLTPEQEKEVLAWMAKNFPEQYKVYDEFSKNNPEMARRNRQRWMNRAFMLMQLAQEEPALADTMITDVKCQDEISRVVAQWQNTVEPSVRSALESQLTELLTKQAEVRLENRRIKLDNISKRLDAERERLKKEKSRIAELVEIRKEELLKPVRKPTTQPGHE